MASTEVFSCACFGGFFLNLRYPTLRRLLANLHFRMRLGRHRDHALDRRITSRGGFFLAVILVCFGHLWHALNDFAFSAVPLV